MPETIIFTDLDGILLDAETYSYEQVEPTLESIHKRWVPLIFVSSKTRAELEVWRDRLQNRHPFISKNGGGIFIPEGYFPFPVQGEQWEGYRLISLGMTYGAVRRRFVSMRERLGIKVRGFGDMTDRELLSLPVSRLPTLYWRNSAISASPFCLYPAQDRP